mgnify:CR=1 FL=1
MPHELALVGIYFSPLLPIVLFGILGALATAFVLTVPGFPAGSPIRRGCLWR